MSFDSGAREDRAMQPVGQSSSRFVRAVVALVLFGVSFGYVEAAVVVYLRDVYAPLHGQYYPERANELFPLVRLDQLAAAEPRYGQYLRIELGREAATLLMLAAVALAVAGNAAQWLAAFGLAFGVWDIFFYVFLKVFVGWPDSLWTWDLLFLVPVPWVGPVLAPVIVSVTMIAAGGVVLWRESVGRPVRLTRTAVLALTGGALIVVVAFCWDFRAVLAGATPETFNWPVFALGEVLGVAALLPAFRATPA
jgi:hypothetical protein